MAETSSSGPIAGRPLAERLAALASSKLATDIVILDMRELVSYTDYLVVCSARNERQAVAITDEVRRAMKDDHGILPVNPARAGDYGWTVLDYMDCVLHVFSGDARELYDLEELWFEAPKSRVEAEPNETVASNEGGPGGDRVGTAEAGTRADTR